MAEVAVGSRPPYRWLELFGTPQAKGAAVAALAALALGSRLWAISHKSIWLDEALSWQFAQMPVSSMLDYLSAADKHPPLYYLALHYWMNAFGDSELALRSLSAVAGAATVALLAMACWRIRGPFLAAVVSGFLILNTTHIYFSQEARMYSLMGFLSLCASLALARLLERPTLVWLLLYAGFLSAAVYTHYSGFVLAAVHGLLFVTYGALALWRERRPHIVIAGAIAFSVTALLYLPWLSSLRQTARLGAGDVPEPSVDLAVQSFKGALGIGVADDLWLVPVFLLVAFGVWASARRWRTPAAMTIAGIAVVPLLQLLISIESKPMFTLRQISPFVPGLVFLLGFGLVEALDVARRAGRYAGIAGALALLVLAGFLTSFMFREFTAIYGRIPIEDWRSAAADLRDFDGPIYITAPYTLGSFKYYYGDAPNVQPFGFWSPENHPAGQTVMIGISHQRADPVLAALGDNVIIEGHRPYWGIVFYEVRVVHHTATNVALPVDQEASGWRVNAAGYAESTSDFSSFTCNCNLDADGDARADGSFTVIIEYLDSGDGQLSLFGQVPPAILAQRPFENTNQWRTEQTTVPAGTPVGRYFWLNRGVVLRRLQILRTQVENTDLFGTYQGTTRWILPADGYVQSTDQHSYINSSVPLDADSDGRIDHAFRLQLEYRGGGSNPLQVFGLGSGERWNPIVQEVRIVGSDGEWQTIDITVAEGARLQPSFFVGTGVTLKSARIALADAAQ